MGTSSSVSRCVTRENQVPRFDLRVAVKAALELGLNAIRAGTSRASGPESPPSSPIVRAIDAKVAMFESYRGDISPFPFSLLELESRLVFIA